MGSQGRNFCFHQKLNGTESQRTLPSVSCYISVIRYSGFFGVLEKWGPTVGDFLDCRVSIYPMTDPWEERYIYLHEWLIFMGNM